MTRNKIFRLAMFMMIAAFVLAACGSGETPPPEVVDALTNVELDQAVDTADEDVDVTDHEDQGDVDSDVDVGLDEDTDAAEEPVAEEPVAPKPDPKSGLEASDPATVMLASGSPQLVEFFAYW